MSRIGKTPVDVPSGVKVEISGNDISVSGSLGELSLTLPDLLSVELEGNQVRVNRSAETKKAKSLHGLFARLINNMVIGVSKGFEKRLEVIGV
ncbi:MAG TPA: 50S ribosomal protein L6, partial [Proteobacteria bacterium]|nr:50S ribosomal protein L6 [Pseudomonadota bacterium]